MQLIKRLSQRGDTIVEVLIAIAVIGAVLGTSYAIVGRNTKSSQQVNERTDAIKLAETQLESIRSYAGKFGSDGLPSSDFCIEGNTVKTISGAGDCVFDSRYTVVISRPSAAAGDKQLFDLRVTWDGINGNTETASLRYRI